MIRFRSPKDAIAGLMFIALAVVFAFSVDNLEVGTASRMGPGYFPLLLCGALGLLGLVVLANGVRIEGPPLPHLEWKGLAILTVAIVVFGATVQRWGFVPAAVLCSVLCAVTSRPVKPVSTLIFVVGLVAFCVAVFVWGLGMPVKLFG